MTFVLQPRAPSSRSTWRKWSPCCTVAISIRLADTSKRWPRVFAPEWNSQHLERLPLGLSKGNPGARRPKLRTGM